MSNVKISELPISIPTSTSIFPFVDSGTTYQGAISSITRPYKVYTALLTQSGGDVLRDKAQGESLDLGITYSIDVNSENADLTIFGAPNSDVGTSFVCTNAGTLPLIGSISLLWNEGTPVVTVLENTIGNIFFQFQIDGQYQCNSDHLFTQYKTYLYIQPATTPDEGSITTYFADQNGIQITTLDSSFAEVNNKLGNTSFEIRVYN